MRVFEFEYKNILERPIESEDRFFMVYFTRNGLKGKSGWIEKSFNESQFKYKVNKIIEGDIKVVNVVEFFDRKKYEAEKRKPL